jgi:hypothetical protein
MQYLGRDRWGAVPPTWNPGTVNPSLGEFIHYNGPPVSAAVLAGDFDSMATFLRGIQRYHMQNNGWPDIAYSHCVDAVGRVWTLRGWGVAQAATMDWNWKSHSIFLPLGGDQSPTDAQIAACRTVIAEHNRRYGVGFVKGHVQAPNQTSCPGPLVLDLIRKGFFDPVGTEAQPPAPPPGADPMAKPIIMRNKTTKMISAFYPDTPFRVDLTSMDDVTRFKFFGAEDKGDQDPWFWKISSAVKTG